MARFARYIRKVIAAGNGDKIRYYFSRNADSFLIGDETFVDSRGATTSLGRLLNDLETLIAWVETGTEPGDLAVLGSTDPLSPNRVIVKGAHQVGLQRNPVRYFERIEGF